MVRRVALTLLILSACSRELRLQPAKSPSARIDPVPPALGRDGAELHLAVSFASRGSDLALDLVRWADDEAPAEYDFWLREPSNDDWSTEKSSLLPPPRAGMGATYDALRGRVVLFGGHGESVEADAGAADFRTGYLGDTWQLTADAPHARHAAEEVAFAVPADAEVSALALAYAGSASGANGAAPVNLAVWLDDGGWLPMGADGGGDRARSRAARWRLRALRLRRPRLAARLRAALERPGFGPRCGAQRALDQLRRARRDLPPAVARGAPLAAGCALPS